MAAKLSKELSDAIQASGDESLEVIDPQSNRSYFIMDDDTYQRALKALRQQVDHDAIAAGIAEMEAGEGQPIDEAFAQLRAKAGFPPRG